MTSCKPSVIASVNPNLLGTILLCLASFPFTPAAFSESYTQPFYLVFSWIMILYAFCAINTLRVAAIPLLILSPLLVLCIAFNIISLDLNALSVMLSIASTLFLWALRPSGPFSNRSLVAEVLHWIILIWLGLAVIHSLGYNKFLVPGHLANAPEVLKASGRGVLSFAPEPTHYALHTAALIVLKFLCDRNIRFFIACLILLLLTSMSSTLIFLSFAALILSFVYKSFLPGSHRPSFSPGNIFFLIIIPLIFIVAIPFAGQFLIANGTTRVGGLLSIISRASPADLMDSLELDGSTCARVNGLIQSIRLSFGSYLLPHGYSSSLWKQASLEYCQYSGVGLSSSVPSGYFSLLFVYGFVALPFLCFLLNRSFLNFVSAGRIGQAHSFAVALAALIPLSQLHFSDPILLLVILIPELTDPGPRPSGWCKSLGTSTPA